MRKTNVIESMLALHAKLARLPPPSRAGYYTSQDLARVMGHTPVSADTQILRALGWVRCAREVNGKTARAWLPPENAHLTSAPT